MSSCQNPKTNIRDKAESPPPTGIPAIDDGGQRESLLDLQARLVNKSEPELDIAERFQLIEATEYQAATEAIQTADSSPAAQEIQPNDLPPASAGASAVNGVAGKYTKHDTYWLPESTILVQIGEVRFKLHRSTLVKHSQWFRDAIENGSHDRCTFVDEESGSIVYCLDSLDVDVDDFVALLNAMDNAITFVHYPQHPKEITAILRAADALDFDQFKTFTMLSLEEEWSSNVDEVTVTRIAYAADTVQLAHRFGIQSVLKRALYELVRAEGFRQVTTEEDDNDRDSGDKGLSRSDYSLLVHAREKLVEFWLQKATPPLYPSTCLSPSHSSAARRCAISKHQTHTLYRILIHDSGIFSKYRYDPICGLDALCGAPWTRGAKWSSYHGKDLPVSEEAHLCSACSRKWYNTWAEEQNKLWQDLDTWLEIDDEEEQETDYSEGD